MKKCRACNEDIDNKATRCKHCHQDQTIFRHLSTIQLPLALVVAAISITTTLATVFKDELFPPNSDIDLYRLKQDEGEFTTTAHNNGDRIGWLRMASMDIEIKLDEFGRTSASYWLYPSAEEVPSRSTVRDVKFSPSAPIPLLISENRAPTVEGNTLNDIKLQTAHNIKHRNRAMHAFLITALTEPTRITKCTLTFKIENLIGNPTLRTKNILNREGIIKRESQQPNYMTHEISLCHDFISDITRKSKPDTFEEAVNIKTNDLFG